ncbi:TPA: hypothetical protein ACQ9QC_001252, partial [Neisseria meningitidis]|uniref:hypothetical protein n=1 Tax=Neisseria meningitidis TaxID=487 RepID=UPI0027D4639B
YLGRKQPKTCVGISVVVRERNFAKVSIGVGECLRLPAVALRPSEKRIFRRPIATLNNIWV